MISANRKFVVIGGGPAGLTAAYRLATHGFSPIVLEKSHIVGGIARTENYKGYHFDMGGHRFFTKSKEVEQLWHEILSQDFLRRPRMSRIYYKQTFFNYPLKPGNALAGLGPIEAVRIILSYLRWTAFPYRREETFEHWVTNRFGKRLFEIFFKSYTEKVWGIPCSELRAEWAAQRIKNLSLKTAVLSMFLKPKNTVTTLIDAFNYPRLGPGMLWRAVHSQLEEKGGSVRLESDVVSVQRSGNHVDSITVRNNGSTETIEGSDFISSMPITEFIKKLDPPPEPEVLDAAHRLKYRDFLTVCLIVNKPDLFPDNWIYIHEPGVQVGRIQNFKNWSPEMVPDAAKSSLGLEYFCNEGDTLWTTSDAELIELGKRELEQLKLANAGDVVDGCVFRVPKSYPVYDADYQGVLTTLKDYVNSFDNFQTIGRNGLHRYNNQDHAMMTGMLAVRNAVLGETNDLWNVNVDQEYHEEIREAPEASTDELLEEAMVATFSKLDRRALGFAVGVLCSVLLCLATLLLVAKGGPRVGQHLRLLAEYFPGYRVSVWGSLVGAVYGFVAGGITGWMFAFLRNSVVFLYLAVIRRRAERQVLRKLLEYI